MRELLPKRTDVGGSSTREQQFLSGIVTRSTNNNKEGRWRKIIHQGRERERSFATFVGAHIHAPPIRN